MYGNREEFEQASKVIDFWGSGWRNGCGNPITAISSRPTPASLKKMSQPNATFRGAAAT